MQRVEERPSRGVIPERFTGTEHKRDQLTVRTIHFFGGGDIGSGTRGTTVCSLPGLGFAGDGLGGRVGVVAGPGLGFGADGLRGPFRSVISRPAHECAIAQSSSHRLRVIRLRVLRAASSVPAHAFGY